MRLKRKKTPGQKLIKRLSLQSKYWICTLSGLILIVVGVLFFQLVCQKSYVQSDFGTVFTLKLLSLATICLGLSIFGKSLIYKMEIRLKEKRKKQKLKLRLNKNENIVVQKNPQNGGF